MRFMESEEGVAREDLDAALEAAMSHSVAPTAFLMVVAYFGLCVAHLVLLPLPMSLVMVAVAGSSSVASAIVWFASKDGHSALKGPQHLLGGLGILILVNISIHMAILEDYLQTTYIALVLVGCGFLMLNRRWFAILLSAYVGTWAILAWYLPPSLDATHFAFLIAISSCVAMAAHIARYRSVVSAETRRIAIERERQRMELKVQSQHAQIVQVSRMVTLGELVAGIAHELNQPLAAISNYAAASRIRLGQLDAHPDETLDTNLRRMGDAAVRGGAIIKRLRGLATHSRSIPTRVNLNDVVEDSIELMSANMRHHNVDLRVELDENPHAVEADEVEMQQVMINLLQNGVDELRERPGPREITVRTSLVDSRVRVSVLDNGAGLQMENSGAVFDAFVTTKDDGMGMGLAICRSILENLGGKIWCDTIHPPNNSGTAFHFSLPPAIRTDRGDGYRAATSRNSPSHLPANTASSHS